MHGLAFTVFARLKPRALAGLGAKVASANPKFLCEKKDSWCFRVFYGNAPNQEVEFRLRQKLPWQSIKSHITKSLHLTQVI